MRLRSTGVFASLIKKKTTIGAQQFPQLMASTAAYLASGIYGPTKIRKFIANMSGIIALAAGITVVDGHGWWRAARAQAITDIGARIVAVNIPGASAISQIGTFLNNSVPPACAHPIPMLFPSYIQPGAVLDPNRILVGSRSNFGAPPAIGVGRQGSFLSIDPSGRGILRVPPDFAQSGVQASTLGGAVQMFSANSSHWLNGVNNPGASTASYTGVSNPLGLSNNNAFGRIWPANAPFGLTRVGSSSILDPTGLPLKGAPSPVIGGVYVGSLTNRNVVAVPAQPQAIPGALSAGAVGTAFLGPSPDGSCKAVFSVVTADGAIVQEHTVKGLDGLAAAGTIQPLLGGGWDSKDEGVEPRLGVLMNPYTATPGAAWQLLQFAGRDGASLNTAGGGPLIVGGNVQSCRLGEAYARERSTVLNLEITADLDLLHSHTINCSNNPGGCDLSLSSVNGNVQVNDNGGTSLVAANVILGNLQCEGKASINDREGGPNTVGGTKQGQCAGF